jgi:hypothetical protein
MSCVNVECALARCVIVRSSNGAGSAAAGGQFGQGRVGRHTGWEIGVYLVQFPNGTDVKQGVFRVWQTCFGEDTLVLYLLYIV